MFGVGGSAARVEIVLATSAAGAALGTGQRSPAPSRTGGPAAGRIGLRKRRPQTSTERSAIIRPPIVVASSRDGLNGCAPISSRRAHSRTACTLASASSSASSTRVSARSRTTSSPSTMTSRTAAAATPKIQCAASVDASSGVGAAVDRGPRGRPARRARVRPRSGSAKARPTMPAPAASRASAQSRPGPELLLAAPQEARSGTPRTGRRRCRRCRAPRAPPSQPSGGRPTPLFMFERGLWTTVDPRSTGSAPPRPGRGARRAPAPRGRPARAAARRCTTRPPVRATGVGLVHRVLGHVDVQAGARPPRQGGTRGQRCRRTRVNDACAPTMPRASG